MDAIVRSATAEDLTSLAVLNRVVQDLHIEAEPAYFRSQTEPDEVENFFRKILSDEHMKVLIAEDTQDAIGYIWFELQDKAATPFTNARRRIYIHHIVVSPKYRKTGAGSLLLRKAEAEACAQGIAYIALDTWAFNKTAQTFFKASGFDPFNIAMRKELNIYTAGELLRGQGE